MVETHHRARNVNNQWFQVAFRSSGRVFLHSTLVALPCAVVGFMLKLVHNRDLLGMGSVIESWSLRGSGFSSFSALLGFLIIFRSAQAYQRYWDGCQLVQQLNGCFYDAVSSVIAFTKRSKADSQQLAEFRSHVVYFFSLMTALCYHELLSATCDDENGKEAHKMMESLDVLGLQTLTPKHVQALRSAVCRPSLVFHWIQVYLIENIATGVLDIPAPILGRAFQELAEGLVRYEDSTKLAFYPFPHAYSQTTLWLLVFHWVLTPFCVCAFTKRAFLASVFAFILSFTYWTLFKLSEELENPFGEDDGDIDLLDIHRHLNARFCALLEYSSVSISAIEVTEALDSGPLSSLYAHTSSCNVLLVAIVATTSLCEFEIENV